MAFDSGIPVALVSEEFESSADSSMEDEDWTDEELEALEALKVAMEKLTQSVTSWVHETRSTNEEMKQHMARTEAMAASLIAEGRSVENPIRSEEIDDLPTTPKPVLLDSTKTDGTRMTQLQIRRNQVLEERPKMVDDDVIVEKEPSNLVALQAFGENQIAHQVFDELSAQMESEEIETLDDLPNESDGSIRLKRFLKGNSPFDIMTSANPVLENDRAPTNDDELLCFDLGGECLLIASYGLLRLLPKSRGYGSILVKKPISRVSHQVLDKMSSPMESNGDKRGNNLTVIRAEVIDLFQLHFVFDPGIVEKEIEVVAGDFIVPSLIAHLKGGGDYLIIARYGLLKEVPEPSIDNQVVTKGFTSLLAAQWLKGKPKGKVVQKVECSGESPKDIDENIQLNLLAVATNYLSGCRVPSLLGINSYSILSLSLEGYLVPKVMPGRCLIFDCNCMSQIGDITMFDFLPARELWTCVAVEDNLSDNVREDKLGAEDAYEDIKLINSVRNFDAGRKAWVLTTVAGDPLILNYSDREGIDQVQLVFDPGGDHLATASAIRENKLTGGADIEKVTKTNVKLGKGKSSLVLICDVERQIKGLVRCFYPGFDVLIFDPEGASMVFDMKEKLTGLDKCSYPCSDMWIFDPGGGELQADHQV